MKLDDESWAVVSNMINAIEKQGKKIDDVTQALALTPESPIREAFYRVVDEAITVCSHLIGDTFELLDWYVYECEFGANPKEAGRTDDMRLIDSHETLRWLIELD